MTYALGIDVGGTTIKIALVNPRGDIFGKLNVPTPKDSAELVKVVADIVADYRSQVAAGKYPDDTGDVPQLIPTVGFNAPGIINEKTGVAEFSANLGWRDFPAREMLEGALGTPVAFGHDVRSGALAESYWGVKLPSFLYIAIGTGIASTLIIENQILAAHPWAGEVGQNPVFPQYRGSETQVRSQVLTHPIPVEQISSASAIARRSHELGLVAADAGAADVYAVANRGNAAAQSVIDTAIATLAAATGHLLAGVGPIPVVLGGGLANEGQPLLDHFSSELKNALGIIPVPAVHQAQLGSWSQAQGAALRAFIAEEVL